MNPAAPCPSLTLVTSVLNGEPFIGELLETIPAHPAVEHLVIDAGSTDGTFARLQNLPSARVLLRPGMPLYEAWNLAVSEATGGAVWFVNADDLLPSGALAAVLSALDRHPDADILQGRTDAFVSEGNQLHSVQTYPAPGEFLQPVDLIFGAPVINGRIFRRRLFERAGPFDITYRYAADREWLLRLCSAATPPVCRGNDQAIYRYRIHDGSMTQRQLPLRRLTIAQEHRRIAASLGNRPPGGRLQERNMLHAWRTRETLVGLAAALRACDRHAALRLGWDLMAQPLDHLRLLHEARRLRRCYLDRHEAAAALRQEA